jgi:uncharacterized protein
MIYLKRFLLISCASLALILVLSGCIMGSSLPPESLTADESSPPADLQTTNSSAPFPLSIEALRDRTYTGSDFVFEETLTPGSNYNRYVISYLSDGLKIYALMTIPWDTKPPTGYPVIIFNHGYIPPSEYRTTERYVAYVDAFASNGYIVVKSDYRGHGDSQGAATSAYGSPDYVIDVLNALASARRYSDVDPNRVGMWGHSMGGYITLRAMVAHQGIKAGVIWAGVVASYSEMFQSWFGGGLSEPRGWRAAAIAEHGTPESNPVFWNSLSANNYLADLSGPIQLHHGTSDTSVPVDYSILLDQQIRAAGKRVELYLWQGDDHNITTHRDDALLLSVVFLNRYVKN